MFRRNSPPRGREARIIQTVAPPQFHASQQLFPQNQPMQSYSKYIPTSEAYITRRVGESKPEMTLRNPHDPKVLANISPPSYQQQNQLPLKLQGQRQFNSPREVSETDLYLLGAIEKLVYRVDYMEKRLKRTEQLVYYLMAGNNQKPEVEPCPDKFTKIGDNCFHFGSNERFDWKSAAGECKSLGASLAEFDKIEKFHDVASYILNNQGHRGHDFWIGGLNPGDLKLHFTIHHLCLLSFPYLKGFCGYGQHLRSQSIQMPT